MQRTLFSITASIALIQVFSAAEEPAPVWELQLPAYVLHPPRYSRGNLYVATNHNKIFAISTMGEMRWTYELDGRVNSTPLVTDSGLVLVSAGSLFAFKPDGTLKWKFNARSALSPSPPGAFGGRIYVTSDGAICALDESGHLDWRLPHTSAWEAPIETDRYGNPMVALGISYGAVAQLLALGADGTERWKILDRRFIDGCMTVDAAREMVFVVTDIDDLELIAVSTGGRVKWRHPLRGRPIFKPTIASDGTVFVIAEGNLVQIFSDSGILEREVRLESQLLAQPSNDEHGQVCFGESKGNYGIMSRNGIVVQSRNKGKTGVYVCFAGDKRLCIAETTGRIRLEEW